MAQNPFSLPPGVLGKTSGPGKAWQRDVHTRIEGTMAQHFGWLVFTPAIKALQEKYGSRLNRGE
jgi:hypothetical protein